ncbi:MAG TPA: hypothetical protein VHO06_21395 [Polyangia bacterium]|nr:hypothetical protein [Polyangia bacterium]
MKHRDVELDPELAALLEFRNVDSRTPADVRARAMARGRAIMAEGGAIPLAAMGGTAPPSALAARSVPVPAPRGAGLARFAAVASIALVVGAVGAVAALRGRVEPAAAPPVAPLAVPAVRDESVGDVAGESPPVVPPAPTMTRSARPPRIPTSADPFTAELELLQRAQAAYARRDLSEALTVVAEHARRFPRGHLAEEREALRVRLLVRMGRAAAAKRAEADFAARFPRSVLLPRVEGASNDPQ